MTDKVREELLALIQKAKDICANDYSDHTENEYIADMILDTGMVNEWIPVTERLPEGRMMVLVYRPIMAIKIMQSFFGDDGFCDGKYDLYGNEVITHWMPLPEAPKDGDT